MRMVVVLRDVYDMPHEEIARELGITQTAAKVRLHRARRRLREQLFATAATAASPSRSRQLARAAVVVRDDLGSTDTRVEEADRHAAAV
jgi:predicted RNA polymerase sigma factor